MTGDDIARRLCATSLPRTDTRAFMFAGLAAICCERGRHIYLFGIRCLRITYFGTPQGRLISILVNTDPLLGHNCHLSMSIFRVQDPGQRSCQARAGEKAKLTCTKFHLAFHLCKIP